MADGPKADALAPPTAPRASLERGWEVPGGRKVMKTLWCWRCKRDIPMLEPDEVNQVFGLVNSGVSTDPFEREWGPALREYERITGFHETNPMALYHHQVVLYGPPCEHCGKPLRTPDSKICGACMMPVPPTSMSDDSEVL